MGQAKNFGTGTGTDTHLLGTLLAPTVSVPPIEFSVSSAPHDPSASGPLYRSLVKMDQQPEPTSSFESIERLFHGDESDAIGRLQARIPHDLSVLLDLIQAIVNPPQEDEDGAYASLSLEVIAGLRSAALESVTVDLIRIATRSRLTDLRFGAIASAGDLSRLGRLEVLPSIKALDEDEDPDIRRAARVFVESLIH